MIDFKADILSCCRNDLIHSPNTAYIAESWMPDNNAQRLAKVFVKMYSDSVSISLRESELLFCSSPNVAPDRIEVSPFFITNLLPDYSPIPLHFIIQVAGDDLHASEVHSIGTSEESTFALIRSIDYPSDYNYTDSFKEYFDSPVLLAVDQTVGIPISVLDRVVLEQRQSISCDRDRNNFIFVKLLSAKIPFTDHQHLFYIDSQNTRLIQERVVDCAIYNPFSLSAGDFTHKINSTLTFLMFYMKLLLTSVGDSMRRPRPFLHFKGPHGSGKSMSVLSLANRLGYNLYFVNCHELCAGTTAAVEEKIKNAQKFCRPYSPLIIYLKNFDVLLFKEKGHLDERLINSLSNTVANILSERKTPFVLVVSTHQVDLPFCLKKLVTKEIVYGSQSEDERLHLMRRILKEHYNVSPIDISDDTLHYLVKSTQSFIKADIELLLKTIFESLQSGDVGWTVSEELIDKILGRFHKCHNNPTQKVNWKDIGGLSNVIEEILQITKLATKGDSLLPKEVKVMRNNGILLYGPPGTGKTLLAKGVATECSINFISVKGPELVNMYVGKSEENVRQLFEQARSAAPCVVFFDELDSLAPRRGVSGDSGGVMDRLVSQLATEIDSVNNQTDSSGIILIGATNRPDLIDPALIRPGRFDQMFFIGGCCENKAKLDVLSSIVQSFPFDLEEFSSVRDFLKTLVDHLPDKITGADLYAICANALQNAFHRIIASDPENADSLSLRIKMHDFETAVSSVELSVSLSEFRKYEEIKDYYSTS